jgi:hypothetical protein
MKESVSTKRIIRTTAVAVVYVWSTVIAINGLHLSRLWMKGLGLVPLALAMLFSIFDRFLWHRPWILRFAQTPDVRGTWLGTYESEFIDDEGKRHRTSGPIALVVKQSFSDISIQLLAEKSRSYSTLARAQVQLSGEYFLDYLYGNTPQLKHREQLTNHFGSARLILPSVRPLKFTGEYWTDRLSRGSLELVWVSSQRVSELADAQALAAEDRREVV